MTTDVATREAPLYTIEEVRAHGLLVPSEEELRRRAVIDRTLANAARRHLVPGESTTAAIRRMRDEAAGIGPLRHSGGSQNPDTLANRQHACSGFPLSRE